MGFGLGLLVGQRRAPPGDLVHPTPPPPRVPRGLGGKRVPWGKVLLWSRSCTCRVRRGEVERILERSSLFCVGEATGYHGSFRLHQLVFTNLSRLSAQCRAPARLPEPRYESTKHSIWRPPCRFLFLVFFFFFSPRGCHVLQLSPLALEATE